MSEDSAQTPPTASAQKKAPPAEADSSDRRAFVKLLAYAVGGVSLLIPLAAGVATFLSPLLRRSKAGESDEQDMVPVATMDAIPADGRPVAFPVVAERQDAWSLYPPAKVGTVYIRRSEGEELQVFTATCPHLGCMVEYRPEREVFACPCHNSFFEPDGQRIDPEDCPSPRALDVLEHRKEGDTILVRFQQFRAGIPEQKPE